MRGRRADPDLEQLENTDHRLTSGLKSSNAAPP
jgi:hypothetical protein